MPKDKYYVLSSASFIFRSIREEANNLNLCISQELFRQIKKYNLTEEKKNKYIFYKINDNLEIVINKKEDFKVEIA